MKIKSDGIPTFLSFEGNIYFRNQNLEVSEWIEHSHAWGQLNYVSQGVMHLNIEGQKFLSPPQYAIWIPPHMKHKSFNEVESVYRSVYLSESFSSKLPHMPCAMSVSDLLKAISNEFARIGVSAPTTRQEKAMAQVALDQIEVAHVVNGYLPFPDSELLKSMLNEILNNLSVKLSTQEIADRYHMTARTLERKCIAEMGIGFGEWQKRARHIRAFEALKEGLTVQQISWELGYSSPSVFINMFKRLTGMTPDQYRKNN